MLLSLFSLATLAVACPDSEHHAHAHRRLGYPPVPLTSPYGPLVWGDFNVIHTTDTHGWLLGHQRDSYPEPYYSGDFGDFSSFVSHMKDIAEGKDVDPLLVDSGDLHDGNGLSDAGPPGEVDGHRSSAFFKQLPYDLMTFGNHELYSYAVAYDMYENFGPSSNFTGRYLASNINITLKDPPGVPMGSRYAKWTTSKGRTVTSLGVIYNFTGQDKNLTVQPVASMVEEQWFKNVVAEETDVFVLVGHMPVSNDSWPVVFNAIRAVQPTTPILIFGGHSHIRDCQQYDKRSMALESGCYMETIGWMSANLSVAANNTNPISFSRRYLDQNRVTYEYHTATSNTTFDTAPGRNITQGLQQLATDFNLGQLFGTAPQDFSTNWAPYPSSGNLVTLYITEAAPVALAINNPRNTTPNIVIANADLLRYDVFKGPFTKNDEFTASFYLDSFLYIPNVTLGAAEQVLPALNNLNKRPRDDWPRVPRLVERRYHAWTNPHQTTLTAMNTTLNPGLVTTDNCSGVGDDTPHVQLPNYDLPHYVSSNPPDGSNDTLIDLVFINFIETHVVDILQQVEGKSNYTAYPYSPTLTNQVLGLYAQAKWNGQTDDANDGR